MVNITIYNAYIPYSDKCSLSSVNVFEGVNDSSHTMIDIIDTMIRDGLWDAFNGYHMGITAENVAEKFQVTREEQDKFALQSHQKALKAQKDVLKKAAK